MESAERTRIAQLNWGEIVVQVGSKKIRFKDCKIWPGGAREWDWNETGTSHDPGVQKADLTELMDKDLQIVILTRGQQGRLQIKPETIHYLEGQDVEVRVKDTQEGIQEFNQLMSSGIRVGGLFHSTC